MNTRKIIVTALDYKKSQTVFPLKKLSEISRSVYDFINENYSGVSEEEFKSFFKDVCYNSYFCMTNITSDEDVCLDILKSACIKSIEKTDCDINKLPTVFKIVFWNLCNKYCKSRCG